jgi:predicted PurR-regulated permease PerM
MSVELSQRHASRTLAGATASFVGFELWIGAIVAAVILHELQWVLLPFVIAGLVAYLCGPIVRWLGRRRRYVGASLVFVVILTAIAGMALVGAPPLMREATHLVVDMQAVFENFAKSALGDGTVKLFGHATNAAQLAQSATESMLEWVAQPGRITEVGAVGSAAILGAFLTLVLLFYFLLSGPGLMRGALWLAPVDQRDLITEIWRRFDPVLMRYFVGVIVVVVYAAVVAYVGLGLVLGLRHAFFLALLTGFLEMIPVVGPASSAVIAGIVALSQAKGLGAIIGYAIYATVLRLSIDQLIGPLVLGAAARLHPVVIIFAFLAGGALFGLPGVILAPPMMLAYKVALAVIREQQANNAAAAHRFEG